SRNLLTISTDGISKENQTDGPSSCANQRSSPVVVSSIATSHRPEEPFANRPTFGLPRSAVVRSFLGVAIAPPLLLLDGVHSPPPAEVASLLRQQIARQIDAEIRLPAVFLDVP